MKSENPWVESQFFFPSFGCPTQLVGIFSSLYQELNLPLSVKVLGVLTTELGRISVPNLISGTFLN